MMSSRSVHGRTGHLEIHVNTPNEYYHVHGRTGHLERWYSNRLNKLRVHGRTGHLETVFRAPQPSL